MNPNTQFERDLEQWLQTEAPASAPAGFHASVMDRARTLRQRPAWATSLPARRFGRGRGMTLLAAAALLIVGGALAGSGFLRLPTVVPPVPAPSVVAVATASPEATSPSASVSAAPTASPIPVAGPGGVWIPTGTMGTPRENPTAVRLQDGRVLMVGGYSGPSGYAWRLTSAELYDPAAGTWSATGSTSKPLVENDAMLLRDGKVLVQVGDDPSSPSGAEVYDPATGTWTATGPMVPDSDGGTLTVLRDGRLLAGGDGPQVYDPATGTWTATGPMVRYSGGDTFTVLRDGRVLDWAGAQVFDPATGTWTATGKRNFEGFGAAAVLLSDGKVLVAGGRGFRAPDNYFDLDSAEVYDPVTGSWTATASLHAKTFPTAVFLQPDGKVLVVSRGGSEVYDPATGTWTAFPGKPGSEYGTATLLSDGTVLATGGDCTAADLYDPPTGSWTTASTMVGCGSAGSFTLLLDGTVLVAGGGACNVDGECGSSGAAELYVPELESLPPFSFPPPAPYVVPSPTPVPTPFPPADGPVPPNARSWKVTVDNDSSEPVTLIVGDTGSQLVGSATPNVVPAGATVRVTFLFPADEDGWIYVNRRPGDGGGLVNAAQIGIPGKIWIREDGEVGWLSP